MTEQVFLTETPRDGFQGIKKNIPTEIKVAYINKLLECGFDTVETGSFVSKRIIPQMADTEEVLRRINRKNTQTKIAVLTATVKGGEKACRFEKVDKIFFPFSTSPHFLKRNINQTLEQAERTIDHLLELAFKHQKELVVYFSWAFGNPYGDPWNTDILIRAIKQIQKKGLSFFPLSDIDGNASPEKIFNVFSTLYRSLDQITLGLHLHSLPEESYAKIHAAYRAGVRHFDTVNGGLGGCPMTGKEMISNTDTGTIIRHFKNSGIQTGINEKCLQQAADILHSSGLF